MDPIKVTVLSDAVRVYYSPCLWITFRRLGEHDLYCGCNMTSAALDQDRIVRHARWHANTALAR